VLNDKPSVADSKGTMNEMVPESGEPEV